MKRETDLIVALLVVYVSMIKQKGPGSPAPELMKRRKRQIEEESISKMFSSSLSCFTRPSASTGAENTNIINTGMKEESVSPLKRIRMTSTDGFVTVKLPNGKSSVMEFKGKQIFAYLLHQLIEEITGYDTGTTVILNGGKILGSSDRVRSGDRLSLLPVHQGGACISET